MIARILLSLAVYFVGSISTGYCASASLSIQITVAGVSGGTPCDIGPNVTDPIPPGAQAAGYTHCAFHTPFANASYATLSNWLDCAGAGSPQWFATGANGAPAPPCSRYAIVNDGGTQVLDMKFTAADAGSAGTSLVTTNDQGARYTRGVDFPNGAYFQATFRVTPASQDGTAVPFGDHIMAWWSWSDTGQTSAQPFFEHDFLETYATGCCHNDTGEHPWFAPGAQFSWVIAGFGQPEYQIDGTVYHTVAERITQDGSSNLAICMYIDGALQVCGDAVNAGLSGAAAITSSQFNQRNYPILVIGPQSSTPVSATMDMYVKEVTIWTCPGWASPLNTPGHACNGPVLTGAP